jgi:hypothetical protein
MEALGARRMREEGRVEATGGLIGWKLWRWGGGLPRSARGAAVRRANMVAGGGREGKRKENDSRRERRVWCLRWRDGKIAPSIFEMSWS